jgi:hypothetical protein
MVGNILQIIYFHFKPCKGHLVILQRLQSYHETDLEVLSYSSHKLASGTWHTHSLRWPSSPSSALHPPHELVASLPPGFRFSPWNLEVVLELVLFSLEICDTKIPSDTRSISTVQMHKVVGGWPYQHSQTPTVCRHPDSYIVPTSAHPRAFSSQWPTSLTRLSSYSSCSTRSCMVEVFLHWLPLLLARFASDCFKDISRIVDDI